MMAWCGSIAVGEPPPLSTAAFLLFLVATLLSVNATPALPIPHPDAEVTNVSRNNDGDIFTAKGQCGPDTCVGLSSGTAGPKAGGQLCTCQCLNHLPAFREDLNICVDDIHECPLAPFVSGSTSQHIPFVFLPLKGQIVHPSKEISFAGVQTPLCAVSGAQFLTKTGWIDLRNPVDADVPFNLFRDEGRTFLQWLGESELRSRMAGRLILVRMVCRDIAAAPMTSGPTVAGLVDDLQAVFTPCVAFRVVGTPIKHQNNVSEVVFSPDSHFADNSSTGSLSANEYVAIGICSILLGLIYVASVFLYLHVRRRSRPSKEEEDVNDDAEKNGGLEIPNDEVIIKSNPLLGLPTRHFSMSSDGYFNDSNSCPSDGEVLPDVLKSSNESECSNVKYQSNQKQLTSALIHPSSMMYNQTREQKRFSQLFSDVASGSCVESMFIQESSNIERLPEENVSIVETTDGATDKPDTVKALVNGSTRRKLYFNPAYFEPHLLLAPPPAAIEFLTKIREVIAIAKQKMATKRFNPSLMGIPEEDSNNGFGIDQSIQDFYSGYGSRRGSSIISLKRENSRRRPIISNCRENNDQDFDALRAKLSEELPACHSCANSTNENKKQNIQKWLENVSSLKSPATSVHSEDSRVLKTYLREQLRSSFDKICLPERIYSSFSEKDSSFYQNSNALIDHNRNNINSKPPLNSFKSSNKKISPPKRRIPKRMAPKVPSPVTPSQAKPKIISHNLKSKDKPNCDANDYSKQPLYDVIPKRQQHDLLPHPDMINEAIEVDNKASQNKRQNMRNGFNRSPSRNGFDNRNGFGLNESQNGFIRCPVMKFTFNDSTEYETDSLERNNKDKGYHTPTEYGDLPSSSQPSPSLSNALPLEEELTITNAVFDIDRSKTPSIRPSIRSEHDYESIGKNSKKYSVPQLLSRSNGYNLVSEVYVNNGYNFGSAPTSPSESDSSSVNSRRAKIRYEPERPGHLTIEVEDCPNNYIKIQESDEFEPDTLDRKSSKSVKNNKNQDSSTTDYVDSLERPNQILLRTTGSFKSDNLNYYSDIGNTLMNGFKRNFGSLREIYEAKNKFNSRPRLDSINFTSSSSSLSETLSWKRGIDSKNSDDEGRILTLEERHSRRQRKSTPTNEKESLKVAPPDVVPPTPPKSPTSIYERPKPPRKVIQYDDCGLEFKPPLPPKNANGRSITGLTMNCADKKQSTQKNEDKNNASSPNSLGLHSSVSGTSVNRLQRKHGEDDLRLCKHQGAKIIENFNQRNDGIRKSINDQFILQPAEAKNTSIQSFKKRCKDTINTTLLEETGKVTLSKKAGKLLVRHLSDKKNTETIKKTWRKVVENKSCKPEDSGYLSTDSNESKTEKDDCVDVLSSVSETDESFGDGLSESGAESVETHSVFFGRYRLRGSQSNSNDSSIDSKQMIFVNSKTAK